MCSCEGFNLFILECILPHDDLEEMALLIIPCEAYFPRQTPNFLKFRMMFHDFMSSDNNVDDIVNV